MLETKTLTPPSQDGARHEMRSQQRPHTERFHRVQQTPTCEAFPRLRILPTRDVILCHVENRRGGRTPFSFLSPSIARGRPIASSSSLFLAELGRIFSCGLMGRLFDDSTRHSRGGDVRLSQVVQKVLEHSSMRAVRVLFLLATERWGTEEHLRWLHEKSAQAMPAPQAPTLKQLWRGISVNLHHRLVLPTG